MIKKINKFIHFCDEYQITMESVGEAISNRLKSVKKDFPSIKFQGVYVEFGLSGKYFDEMSEQEKREYRETLKKAFNKAYGVYNKEFNNILQQLAHKANMDASKVKSLMKLEMCNITASDNKKYVKQEDIGKIRFNTFYNDKNSPKELFNGQCIAIHLVIDGNNVSSSYKIFDPKKEQYEG